MLIDWRKLVTSDIPDASQLDHACAIAGRKLYPAILDPVPDNSKGEKYPAGMTGGSNQEDRLLRWFLRWKLYGDEIAHKNFIEWGYYRATHSPEGATKQFSPDERWDNGHNQEAGTLPLVYLEMLEAGDPRAPEILNGVLLYYNNDICTNDRYPRTSPYTLSRPMARIWGTHLRVIHSLMAFRDAGYIKDVDGWTRRRLEDQRTRVLNYIVQVLGLRWRKDGDKGFFGEPGEWNTSLPLNVPGWRGSSGQDENAFMIGSILMGAFRIIEKLEPEFFIDHDIAARAGDVSEFFLDRWYSSKFAAYFEAQRGKYDTPTLVALGPFRDWASATEPTENIDHYHELFACFYFMPRRSVAIKREAVNFLRHCTLPNGRVMEQLCDLVANWDRIRTDSEFKAGDIGREIGADSLSVLQIEHSQ